MSTGASVPVPARGRSATGHLATTDTQLTLYPNHTLDPDWSEMGATYKENNYPNNPLVSNARLRIVLFVLFCFMGKDISGGK